jgi:deazaflavin-dependent oxidoreductase (nitroreductase family)
MGLGLYLLCLGLFSGANAQAQETSLHDKLAQLAEESTLTITTLGRKSGKPRTKPIWFVYERGHLYIQSGKAGKTHWYRNLQKNAQTQLKIAQLALTGKAKFIEDRVEMGRVHTLFSSKYTFARFAGLLGSSIGQGKVVEVELLTELEQE